MVMLRLTVDFDNETGVWFAKTSDLFGVHAEGNTFDELCRKLPAIVNDMLKANDILKDAGLPKAF
jgi:predicted RNase H-like HicB family nuclease